MAACVLVMTNTGVAPCKQVAPSEAVRKARYCRVKNVVDWPTGIYIRFEGWVNSGHVIMYMKFKM